MQKKPEINEQAAEELIKGKGRDAVVVVHSDGLVTATAIQADPSDARIQNEVDGILHDIQRQYSIVKRKVPANWR
jgi:hypothetical protein